MLNDGTVSPRHDALVNDGTRSVLGCALSHLNIFQRIVSGDISQAYPAPHAVMECNDSEADQDCLQHEHFSGADEVLQLDSAGDQKDIDSAAGSWTLVLEDDFYFPPHFLTVLSHAWAALPRSNLTSQQRIQGVDADLVYLGAGSNNRGPLAWLNRWVFRPTQTVGT